MNHLKSITKIGFVLIIFFTNTLTSYGQYNKRKIKTVSGKPIEIANLDKRINQIMDSIQLPGLSIAIINDAKVVYHNTFGVVNIESKEPVTKQTIFEGASLSKPLFAYFVMKNVEQGKLDLDEAIYPYLESIFPPEVLDSATLTLYKMITPRIVLSHGTGIPNWPPKGTLPINFTPGTGYSYSGEAYQHLAAALGTKLGIGWGSELDSLFLDKVAYPLKMESSCYTWSEKCEKYKAKGHKKGIVNMKIYRDKKVGSGYSLKSEALDFAQFLIEMMEPKNLSQKWIDEMLKGHNHFDTDSNLFKETGQTGWGLGFAQKPTTNGLMHLHTGNNHDFQAYAMFVPDQKYGFVMFANSDNLYDFLLELEELIEKQF